MIDLLASLGDKARIGNEAAWHLAFHRVADAKVETKPYFEVGRDSYHAEIEASMPANFAGGTYKFVIEGMTDGDYAKIAETSDKAPKVVRLYLFWRDTNKSVGGYLANFAGVGDLVGGAKAADLPKEALVAELQISNVTRRTGARRYEAVITASERIFSVLSGAPLQKPVEMQPLKSALRALLIAPDRLSEGDVEFVNLELPDSVRHTFGKNQSPANHMRNVLSRLEEATGKRGRGMALIRTGKLYIGPRNIPLNGEATELTIASGLIDVEKLESVVADPNAAKPVKRRQFKVVLKGRGDIKPGDTVKLEPPPSEVEKTGGGLFGAVAGLVAGPLVPALGGKASLELYVASVEHKLGRVSGFATTLTGVEIKSPADQWDRHSKSQTSTCPDACGDAANVAVAAANAVRDLAEGSVARRCFPEVGEVRAFTYSGEGTAQTELVWAGLVDGDGRARQSRELAIRRPSGRPLPEVGYLSPFAWGKTGLVLPRYPGTRVLLTHRGGDGDDPIDIGALWEKKKAPNSEPGDWWLILPVDAAKPSTLDDGAVPVEHAGSVSQDLIDGAGNRIIEVGELTLRVTRKGLKEAGTRPDRAEVDSITIEHKDGDARIVIDANGTIRIEGTNLEFTAQQKITLKAAEVSVE